MVRSRMRYARAFLPLLSVLVACSAVTPSDAEYQRFPSHLTTLSGQPSITAPDTVAVNAAFTVTVYTAGGGCTRQGETETSVAGLVAELRPFEYYINPSAAIACTADFRSLPHTASVTFAQTGRATIRAIGRKSDGEQQVYERQILVR